MINAKQAMPDLIMLYIVNSFTCEDFWFKEMHFPCRRTMLSTSVVIGGVFVWYCIERPLKQKCSAFLIAPSSLHEIRSATHSRRGKWLLVLPCDCSGALPVVPRPVVTLSMVTVRGPCAWAVLEPCHGRRAAPAGAMSWAPCGSSGSAVPSPGLVPGLQGTFPHGSEVPVGPSLPCMGPIGCGGYTRPSLGLRIPATLRILQSGNFL